MDGSAGLALHIVETSQLRSAKDNMRCFLRGA
jgi:hypothetical protein